MQTDSLLLGIGAACVIAAVVGGGLKAAGAEFPVLNSRPRQALLALVGIALFGMGFYLNRPQNPGPNVTTTAASEQGGQGSVSATRDGVSLQLSRASGPVDATIVVTGKGFQGDEVVGLNWESSSLKYVSADPDGVFADTISVPEKDESGAHLRPGQQYEVIAIGPSARWASVPFKVT